MASKVRLYVDHPLGREQTVPLDRDQAHYLFGVMRLGSGDLVWLFNGRDGEWQARVAEAGKRGGVLACEVHSAPLAIPPDLWLCFAPIKKARTDFIVEKAVEMGARRIVPVLTERTNAERVRVDRLQAHAVEAAEQCGGTYVPEVAEPVSLGGLLRDWPAGRRLLLCDEALAGEGQAGEGQAGEGPARLGPDLGATPGAGDPWAILIGPEGGFSPDERARLLGLPFVHAVALGPRILRADTAAVAALTLWQLTLGDWRREAADATD